MESVHIFALSCERQTSLLARFKKTAEHRKKKGMRIVEVFIIVVKKRWIVVKCQGIRNLNGGLLNPHLTYLILGN